MNHVHVCCVDTPVWCDSGAAGNVEVIPGTTQGRISTSTEDCQSQSSEYNLPYTRPLEIHS